jgi:hypothetical protein
MNHMTAPLCQPKSAVRETHTNGNQSPGHNVIKEAVAKDTAVSSSVCLSSFFHLSITYESFTTAETSGRVTEHMMA